MKRKLPKARKGAWFVRLRGSYLPCSWQGWLTYVPYIYFLAISFLAVDHRSHSASDTIIGIVPFWVSAAIIMHWIASRKS